MARLSLLLNISIIFLIFILLNAQEINTEKNDDNNNQKTTNKWTTQALVKYTLKHHGKDNYFICDPLNIYLKMKKR